jgi:hypothetical protein
MNSDEMSREVGVNMKVERGIEMAIALGKIAKTLALWMMLISGIFLVSRQARATLEKQKIKKSPTLIKKSGFSKLT